VISTHKLKINHHQLYHLLDKLDQNGFVPVADYIRTELNKHEKITSSAFIGAGLDYLKIRYDNIQERRDADPRDIGTACFAVSNNGSVS
jgi:hypothetical protein